MREQYNLDRLSDYSVEDISDTLSVVNPEYRTLDGQVRSHVGKLNRRLAEFGEASLEEPIEPKKVAEFMVRKVDLQDDIEYLQQQVSELKRQRKETQRHITINELPEDEKFKQLSTKSKYLIDSIKMIAYRSETAMANILTGNMSHPNEARSLLQALYKQEADLIPDEKNKTLTICLHHMTNHSSDRVIQILCDELNATETFFPRTQLKLIYKLGSK